MRRLGGTFSRLVDELVRTRTGLAPSRRHEDVKQRVVHSAMERAGVSDEGAYLALLQRDTKTYDDLIADLTVPETYFFRDPSHYELLRREVLPAIRAAHGDGHVVEVWSAGCASGEEPYSLAILLEQERLGKRSHVLGSDVSYRALARALNGTYSRWSLRATSERERARYFESAGSEHRLISRIRGRARFVQHSLSSPIYPTPYSREAGFDLILCRNVLIYFDPQATLDTAQRLARSLAEGGWLLTGPSDPRLELDEWCDVLPTPSGMLYRRRRTSAHTGLRKGEDQARAVLLGARAESPRGASGEHAWHSQASPDRHARGPRSAHPGSPAGAAARSGASASRAHDLSVLGAPTPPDARAPAAPRPPTPSTESAAVEQVRALEREHGSAAAETGCRDLLRAEPLSAGLHVLHAMLLLDLGRDALAEQALRRGLYLDRSLLIAQLLAATLAERRGDRAGAAAGYSVLAEACRARDQDAPVPLGDGLTYAALGALAAQRYQALASGREQTRSP